MSDPHGHETVGIPMELVGVRIELPTNQPIVLLREADGPRYLPIWIGAVEATAIAYALEGVVPQRPLTHDLLKTVSESLGATVARVVVTELRDSVYYADLVLIDPEKPYLVEPSNVLFKCGWSPFEGHAFSSTIDTTIVNGAVSRMCRTSRRPATAATGRRR